MKKLYLLRHADAEHNSTDDIARQLSKTGHKEAITLANAMLHKKISCDIIFCSSAARACQTCDAVASSITGEVPIQKKEELYYIDLNKAMNFVKNLNESYESVLIVGHNPTMSALATQLTGNKIHFTTGILKYLELDINSWDDIVPSCGKLVWSLPN